MLTSAVLVAGYLGIAIAMAYQQITAPDPYTGDEHLDDDGTVVDTNGVPLQPDALAAGAGMDVDAYSLARCITAEEGTGYAGARLGVGFAIRNQARHSGHSITKLVTRAVKTTAADGFYGKQAQGRYCASSHPPDADAISVALQVLSGDVDDPTGGARQFDSPAAFGVQEGTDASDADAVAAKRIAAGNVLVTLPGVPESHLRFWRPA